MPNESNYLPWRLCACGKSFLSPQPSVKILMMANEGLFYCHMVTLPVIYTVQWLKLQMHCCRWQSGLQMRAIRCAGCLDSIPFARNASKCQECGIIAHNKVRRKHFWVQFKTYTYSCVPDRILKWKSIVVEMEADIWTLFFTLILVMIFQGRDSLYILIRISGRGCIPYAQYFLYMKCVL